MKPHSNLERTGETRSQRVDNFSPSCKVTQENFGHYVTTLNLDPDDQERERGGQTGSYRM